MQVDFEQSRERDLFAVESDSEVLATLVSRWTMPHGGEGAGEDRKRAADESYRRSFFRPPKRSKTSRTESHQRRERQQQGDTAATWSPEIHRTFVQSIFLVGMNRASPAVLSQNMTLNPDVLNAERIKSHLQKFRKNKDKSIQNFMEEYDSALSQKIAASYRRLPTSAGNDADKSDNLGSQVAANLTYECLVSSVKPSADETSSLPQLHFPPRRLANAPAPSMQDLEDFPSVSISSRDVRLPNPNLSPEELETPLGRALHHVIGSIAAMTDQLNAIRGTAPQAPPSRTANPAARARSDSNAAASSATTNTEVDATLRQLWNELNTGSSNANQQDMTEEDDLNSLFSRTFEN